MKLINNCVVGNHFSVDDFTSSWLHVKLHPTTFYRRLDSFRDGFLNVRGMYAELDLGQYISIRFTDKDDLTEFYRRHHAYI